MNTRIAIVFAVTVMLLGAILIQAQVPDRTPAIASVMESLMKGSPVIIETWGASTYLGTDPVTGIRSADNPPAILERVLRRYYGNDAIRVMNPSIAGFGTSAMVKLWPVRMSRSSANLIYIGYGINDVTGQPQNPAISADDYASNLDYMITVAQESGRAVILDTPHAIADWRSGIAEQVKIFAEAARSVAARRGIPLVDSYSWSEAAYAASPDMAANLPDAVHLNPELLKEKGYLMAGALIQPSPSAITGPAFVPSNTSHVMASSPHRAPKISVVPASSGSRGNTATCAESYAIAVRLDSPNLDLYLGASAWSNGPTMVEVQLDESVIGNLNLRYLTQGAVLDQEILIAESLRSGVHVIKLKAEDGACVPFNYLRTYWTRKPALRSSLNVFTKYIPIAGLQVDLDADSADFHVLTDLPVSRFIRPAEVSVEADLGPGQGFVLFGNSRSAGSRALPLRGGLYVYLDAQRALAIKEWTGVQYSEPYVVNSNHRFEGKHRYSVNVDVHGATTLAVDNQAIGGYQLSTPLLGGFVGFYSEQPGKLFIDQVTVN